ncbi:response regulator [Sphingomonas koreensis]|uniref:histidine kinase n=1 Tax=Sphingomonas koreensis TaxID=93064 RepID=A0A2M8WFZ8_9SPHN|nr:CHASE3 domain-containing protein [Sphingomonas koreensis]PJI89861.1 signal transduction histidine kinase [Sphingomonas koreensis]RSU55883.1 response regulator [Sphingomonas koreensis]RSU64384.1 response regulator [Sphingomonas koreensis]RSY78759.1 response regulator [Sphingomonas koreensis]
MGEVRRDRGLIALIIGFAVIAVAVFGTLLLFKQQQSAQRMVVHTLRVQEQLSTIRSRLQDAETGQRGYLVTRDPVYLQPYFDGRRQLAGDLAALRPMLADNPIQLAAARQLEQCAVARVERLSVGLTQARAGRFDHAAEVVRVGVGKTLMDRCRAIIGAMKAEESRLLTARSEALASWSSWLTLWLIGGALMVFALAVYATRDARRRARAAIKMGQALLEANRKITDEAESRAAVEAQLRQMQKMESIGQLTGGVAHDFNNMLAIVIGSLDMAKRRFESDPKKALEGIGNAMEGAERAAQLTARLLAFSRQQPLAPKALDANKLVGGMSELLRRTISENIRIETVLAGGLWPAFIDGAQLENAVLNLCVNARDAMPGGGRLTIETANTHLDDAYAAAHAEVLSGQYVMVSVTDTGTGMPPEVIERAFDPFYTTKGVGKGTGLGLSQVFGFVKQSGGHVKIYSEPGVGTTVKLYLPRHFGEAETPGVPLSPDALPRAKDDEIILVVEDEEGVRHMSVDALRELGYVVVQASDANQALTVLEIQPRIDLLFTDIVMPDMNGRVLSDRAREARPGLKVLYTTGYTRNAIVHNGMLDHDVAFLAKPFTVQQLALKVREVLDA